MIMDTKYDYLVCVDFMTDIKIHIFKVTRKDFDVEAFIKNKKLNPNFTSYFFSNVKPEIIEQ